MAHDAMLFFVSLSPIKMLLKQLKRHSMLRKMQEGQ
jgi:hypothetical protein